MKAGGGKKERGGKEGRRGQGRIQKYGLGGREGVGSRPLPSPGLPLPFPFPPFPSPFLSPFRPLSLEVGPLNPGRRSGGAL